MADGANVAELFAERYALLKQLQQDGKELCELIPKIRSTEMQSTYCHILADLIAVL